MQLEPNDDQKLLLDSADAMFARHYKPGFRATAVASATGWSDAVWQASTELGLTTLTIDDEFGGAAAGPAEVYVVQQAIGRHAAVEPLLDGVYLPSWLIAALGSDEQRDELLPTLANGTAIGAVAVAEPGREWDALPAVTAERSELGGPVWLSGVKSPVARADRATFFLVTATDTAGVLGVYLVAADAPGITRGDGRTTDWTHASRMSFDRTPATALGQPGRVAAQAVDLAFARARVALLGEAVGLMESALGQTVEYLKSRKQFGVPLSAFQALVHRAADLYAQIELARSIALWATATLEASDDAAAAAAAADDGFVFVAETARLVAEEAVQLHGGIGMTFETAVSHYAARLTAIGQSFGGSTAARRRALNSPSPLIPPSALRNADRALLPA
ncbi:acyl-CoA dehydrogenase family protein [Nocardia sp. CDC159]|uniref:Acyl-CoA dehydrogenase family protein n=1 Tax=Nocardia pulmonis TaxID=2951408 RepID=A0A9X2E4L1_9NOCA|nr:MULTISPECIES: acyl-CoA dehydrogenase family protein [Nocardia]MCM6774207.1 acyl-CoA dehydrogenase family protein [Nocardia pulmonis]MCM6787094.1 acyl-CoA dehydrogenase family protein [Nocardia sp. CDC159]